MSLQIKVPPVGESITEVTLSRWIKKDGDSVAMDEVIAELESDKATFELTAEKAGTLKIIAKEGDTLAIGAPVANIEDGGAATAVAQPQPEVVANAPAPAPALTDATPPPGQNLIPSNATSQMIDVAQVQGQVHAQSVHRVGELADRNPSETVSIIRQWLSEPA